MPEEPSVPPADTTTTTDALTSCAGAASAAGPSSENGSQDARAHTDPDPRQVTVTSDVPSPEITAVPMPTSVEPQAHVSEPPSSSTMELQMRDGAPATPVAAPSPTLEETPPPETTAAPEGTRTPEAGGARPPREVKVGERVRGRIVSIGDDETRIDFSGREEGRIRTAELRGRDNQVLLRVGDVIGTTVLDASEPVRLTLGKKRGALQAARLRLHLENGTPVSGTVRTLNKGGFEVSVEGLRAFCPLSHIESAFADNPKDYVGKSFQFRVLRWENNGRNIVVSRRAVLREEAKQRARELRSRLVEGTELEGVIKRLQSFGAFVDLGGLEGLLHVSRMAHGRIDDPSQVVAVGDKVQVRIVKVENPGTRRERIALALADLGPDPWEEVSAVLHEGEIVTGTVARLVPFGAFVRLPNGLDGLVHVSELSGKPVNDPKEAVSPGQEVRVRVLRIDAENRRISLSLRRLDGEPERPARTPRREGREARRGRRPRGQEQASAGAQGSVTLTHTMAEQLGHLKDKLRSTE